MLYVVSPLAMAGQPPADEAVAPPPLPVIENTPIARTQRSYVVFDAPAVRPMRLAVLDKGIIEEVERGSGAPSSLADGDAATDPTSVGDEVIAAHEERIALIRQRIGALGKIAAVKSRLGDLRRRLRRAEAARTLAVARVGGGSVASIARVEGDHRGAAANLTGVRGIGGQAHAAVAAAHQDPGGTRSAASTQRQLAHARQSLATARRLLQPDPPSHAGSPDRPPIQIAGLVQWPGSATWTLAAYGG